MKNQYLIYSLFAVCLLISSALAESIIVLEPETAILEKCSKEGNDHIKDLNTPGNKASWQINVGTAGDHIIEVEYSAPWDQDGSVFEFNAKETSFEWKPVVPGWGWDNFGKRHIGQISLRAGKQFFSITAKSHKGIDLRRVKLIPIDEFPKVSSPLSLEFDLRPENAYLGNCFSGWKKPSTIFGFTGISWNIVCNEEKQFLIILNYSNPHKKSGGATIYEAAAGSSVVKLEIPDTGGWETFKEEIVGVITLPKGITPFSLSRKEKEINLRSVKLVSDPEVFKKAMMGNPNLPHSTRLQNLSGINPFKSETLSKPTQEQLSELKKKSRLGMTLEELEKLWGKSSIRQDNRIERRGDQTDKDWPLYESIKPETTNYQWHFRESEDLSITAVMWKGKCVALDIAKRNGFSPQESVKLAETMIPRVKFGGIPTKERIAFTAYSTSPEKAYILQNWGHDGYFELKAFKLINDIKRQHPNDLLQGVNKISQILKSKKDLEVTTLFGKTPQQIGDYLESKLIWNGIMWCGKPTRRWESPTNPIVLYFSFTHNNGKEYCQHITITDREKELTPESALLLAKQLTSTFTLPNVSKKQLGESFSIRSTDKDKRFRLEWYQDKFSKYSLQITDEWPNIEAQREKEQKNEKAIKEIKDIL